MEETTTNQIIGDNIRTLRLKANLTQTELANLIQLSRMGIVKMESGESAISIDTLVKLCKALKTTPNHILKGVNKKS